jgi:hypothetical protein
MKKRKCKILNEKEKDGIQETGMETVTVTVFRLPTLFLSLLA